jgi:hypothetical protein
MCNEFKGAQFTLENFRLHNADIPIRVVNSGGQSPEQYLRHIKNIEFIDAPNLWHKCTSDGIGSLGPMFFDYLFDYGLNENYTHTLYLEPDVLTNRAITIEPQYDISGVLSNCGAGEHAFYDALGINDYRVHTGNGGTIYKHNYFATIKQNGYEIYQQLFKSYSQHYHQDLIATVAARLHGLTFGHWEECSQTYGQIIDGKFYQLNPNATLIHGYKIK